MKHLYKKLHTSELVDINLLALIFQHKDVYMRDVIVGAQSGISESDMLKIESVVSELCLRQD
jgi:hypothetical protein